MTNEKLFNKILTEYNENEALELLKSEFGVDRLEYEMERFGFDKLTKSNFVTIAQEWCFFEDYISDENWIIYNPYK